MSVGNATRSQELSGSVGGMTTAFEAVLCATGSQVGRSSGAALVSRARSFHSQRGHLSQSFEPLQRLKYATGRDPPNAASRNLNLCLCRIVTMFTVKNHIF